MKRYYVTKNKNEFNIPMVMETFNDDDSQYGFYWHGDNEKWSISDCGTKSEVICRLQKLIHLCEKSIAVCKTKGWNILQSAEAKEIKIYKELIAVLENM